MLLAMQFTTDEGGIGETILMRSTADEGIGEMLGEILPIPHANEGIDDTLIYC